jgi:DNA-binding response OmpR family regulator
MKISPEQVGVVVVMDRTMVSGLAKLAQRHRWSLIHLPTAAGVRQAIGRQRLDIAVVQIAVEPQQAVELLRWLRATRKELLLIAVASDGGEDVERMARLAGVQCYLTQTDDVTLERAVNEMLEAACR